MSQKEKTLSDFPEYVRINDKVQALRAQKQKAIDRIAEIDAEQSKPKHQATGQEAWKRALEDNYRFKSTLMLHCEKNAVLWKEI